MDSSLKKYAIALTFLLIVSGCSDSSDTAIPATTVAPAVTQAPTTTAVPTTTVAAATSAAPTTLVPAAISACRAQMKKVYKEQTDWDAEGDKEFISSLNTCVSAKMWSREYKKIFPNAQSSFIDTSLKAGCMLYPNTAVCRDQRGLPSATTAVPVTTATPSTAAVVTTTGAPTTTLIVTQPYFEFLKLTKVTPDKEINIPGAFCRINHRNEADDLIVTFGGAGKQGIFEQGHGYKTYTKKLEPKAGFGVFYPFGGDAASLLIDDIFYFATGSPNGWRLLKFDVLSWEKLSEMDYAIDQDYELENDNMLSFVGGLLDVSGLHVSEGSAAHRDGVVQSGPLESRLIDHDRGYSTHHRFFTTDFDFIEYKVLKDSPQFFGTSILELGDSIYLITSDSFLGNLTALRYDKEWKYLETIELGISGTWPQGVIFDPFNEYIHLAFEAGKRGLRNIHLATFDKSWNLIEEIPITDFSWGEEKVASRPWLLMLEGMLYVSFDVMSVGGKSRQEVLDNECWVKSYSVFSP